MFVFCQLILYQINEFSLTKGHLYSKQISIIFDVQQFSGAARAILLEETLGK